MTDTKVTILDVEQDDPVRIKEERDILLQAIFEMGVKAGFISTDTVSAPELLRLLDDTADFITWLERRGDK